MKNTTMRRIEADMSDIFAHVTKLEYENHLLKSLVREIASSINLDQDGNTVIEFSPEAATHIKSVCERTNVFLTQQGDNDE